MPAITCAWAARIAAPGNGVSDDRDEGFLRAPSDAGRALPGGKEAVVATGNGPWSVVLFFGLASAVLSAVAAGAWYVLVLVVRPFGGKCVLPTSHPRSRNFMQRSYILWSWGLISWSPIQPRRAARPRSCSQAVGYELGLP